MKDLYYKGLFTPEGLKEKFASIANPWTICSIMLASGSPASQ